MAIDNDRIRNLFQETSRRAGDYIENLENRSVAPSSAALEGLEGLKIPLPERGLDSIEVLRMLDEIGAPATMASAGPRFFGFVVGGALPVTVAANWLAATWDQNAPVSALSPVGAVCEGIAIGWIVDLLGLPKGTWGGFVTGATEANFTALTAARNTILRRQGWEIAESGIFGAPEIRVIVGEEVHVSVLMALRLLGFGRERLTRVPTDHQGQMLADALPELDATTIICIQAGNVNTGGFDPAQEICERAAKANAWVHVDGAFGLWAAASPVHDHLTAGVSAADSWATDAHKWLNVPYDCGIVLCRNPEYLVATMALDPASYLGDSDTWEPHDFTFEMSRRARGIEVWAALRSLGRAGVAELIYRTCEHASLFASRLSAAGYTILNDVVINQVLVDFGDEETTQRIIDGVQADGTCWMGGTTWHGKRAMRISVSSWATTTQDVERSVDAILKVAARQGR